MAIVNPVTQLLLPAAVVALMFALGTTLTLEDLRRVLLRPRAFLLGLLAHTLVLPATAFAVAAALALPGPLAAGLVLIASCPANASSNVFSHLARGDTMLSICLTAAASLTSVLTVPLFVTAALRLFPAGLDPIRLPVAASALGLFLVSTLPVLAGMWLRLRRPETARAIEARVSAVGLGVIVLVVAAAIWSEKDEVAPALVRAGGPALLVNALSVSTAWGVCHLAGLPRAQRIAVGLECGLQNFAMAAFVALTLVGSRALLLPAIAYGVTMWLSAAALVLLARRGWGASRHGTGAAGSSLSMSAHTGL
jgi:BASS family bile acid:Na+ symporter